MKHLKWTHFGRAGVLCISTTLAVTGSCQALSIRPFGQGRLDAGTFDYVAIGDSITTGSSIATCQDDRKASPWGCSESHLAAVPYPNRVAIEVNDRFSNNPADYTRDGLRKNKIDLYRAGIWGYTLHEAVQQQNGKWQSQLAMIPKARQFVTGNLGINDLHFSDVNKWAKLYLKNGPNFVSAEARRVVVAQSSDFDKLFSAFRQARNNGTVVVTTLYYNPYDTERSDCTELKDIGSRIVNALDSDLDRRARENGLKIADFRRGFTGHGSGSAQSYVFGQECSLKGAISTAGTSWIKRDDVKRSIGIKFDPHPNNYGTLAMTKSIMEQINGSD